MWLKMDLEASRMAAPLLVSIIASNSPCKRGILSITVAKMRTLTMTESGQLTTRRFRKAGTVLCQATCTHRYATQS